MTVLLFETPLPVGRIRQPIRLVSLSFTIPRWPRAARRAMSFGRVDVRKADTEPSGRALLNDFRDSSEST